MSARTTPTLLDRIREAGLLDGGRVKELAGLPEARDPNPKALARAILQRGWLTRYQLAAVARGEAASLHAGPYLIAELIGEGGMGQVFRATHKHMARTVALKLIRLEKLQNPQAVARFYREAQAAARLSHPNIVTAFDAGPTGQTHYFAMELVEGVDLARLVKQRGPLSAEAACDHVRQAALGLQHAHEQGLVHRDIKPHNLVVTPDGTVKLLDLGLARLEGDQKPGVTRLDQVLGTPDYLPPEQAVNAWAADIRADIYALGCTLYHLLAGQPPFRAATLSQVLLAHQFDTPAPLHRGRPDVPASLSAVVERMMAKRPEDRYQIPGEVAEALRPFCPALRTRKPAIPPPLPPGPLPARQAADQAEALTPTLAGTSETPSFRFTQADALPDRVPQGRRGRQAGRMLVFLAAGGTLLLLALLTALFLVLLGRPRSDVEVVKGDDQGGEVTPPTVTPRPPAPKVPGPDEGSDTAPAPEVKTLPQARQAFLLQGPTGPVRCTAVSPDSRLAASGSADRSVRLWDLNTGREVHAFTGLPAPPDTLAFSPDGSRLAATCGETLTVWAVADKKAVPNAGKSGSFLAPFGQLVLAPRSEAGNLTLSVREVRAEREYGNLKLGAGKVRAVRFTPDARLAAVLDEGGMVWVFDLGERREMAKLDLSAEKPTAIALTPDGTQLLVGTATGTKVWDLTSTRPVRSYEEKAPGPANFLALSPDGRRALVGRPDGKAGLWDHGRGVELLRMAGHTGAVTSAVFSPDGRRVVTGSEDGTVRVWELEDQGPSAFTPPPLPPLAPEVTTLKPLRDLKGSTMGVVDLDISPTGRYVAAVDGNNTVRVWVLRSGSLTRIEERLPAEPRQVSFGGRGRYLRAFTGEEVHQWNLQALGQPKAKAALVADRMSHPAEFLFKVVPTGTGGDLSLAVFDLRTGRLLRRLPTPDETGLKFGYSPDGSYVAVVGLQGTVQVIDLRKVREVSRVEAGMVADRPEALCLDAEGKRLFVGSADGSIRVFDVKEKTEVARFKGKHEGPVRSLACTRDGRWLLSGGEDKSVRLWDVESGYERLRCAGHTLPVRHVRIDPEDRYAVTGGGDDLIHVWDLSAREDKKSD
jgi:WD40 repeat protein/serine/threonine protein kinase